MARQTTPKLEMRCCVPLCSNDADKVSKPGDISFHMFPDTPDMRQFWLEALDLTEWHRQNPDAISSAVVCSEHFASADLFVTKNGFQKLRTGAVPLVIQETLEDEVLLDNEEIIEQLQVCRVCLETEGRLISISESQLEETYQNLTGFSMSDDERLSQTLCPECTQRLRNFGKFREKCLTADLLLTNILKRTDSSVKEEFMKIERNKLGLTSNLVQLFINYDHFDLFIQEDPQSCQSDDNNKQIARSNVEMDELTVLNFNNESGAGIKIDKLKRVAAKPGYPRLAPKPMAPIITAIPNTPQNLLQIAPKRNFTPNFQKIAPKINISPIKQTKKEIYTSMHTDNKSILKTGNKRNTNHTVEFKDSVQKMNVNKPITGSQVKVKNEFDPDNGDQANKVKVDYIPVIDVVIDNKFKIVRKEEVLMKNAQIIISDNKATPIVQELDKNRAIIRNKRGIPIGIDLSKGSLPVPKVEQPVLPIMTRDRIIMPNQDVPKDMATPQNTPFQHRSKMVTKTIQTEHTPIIQNVTNRRSQQMKSNTTQIVQQNKSPKNTLTNQQSRAKEKPKNIPSSTQENRKNVVVVKTSQKHMPILDDEQNNMQKVDNEQFEVEDNQIETENEHVYTVPVTNYDEHELYEESVEETVVTEDYLDMQSEPDNEMENIKREVEDIIKEDKENSSNAYTDNQIENFDETTVIEYKEDQENNDTWDENQENSETWDENQENNETWDENQENSETWDENQENNETWDENQENNETWDENQENNETWGENQESNDIWNESRGKWEPDEFSEDNDNYQNSEYDQNEETTVTNKVDKFNPEQMKRNRMHRKRRSVLPNYGKAYFSDDLNDVIFTIQQLTYEEQLEEIKNRLHTKYKNAPFSCSLCYRGFMNEYAFKRHTDSHNNEEGEYECGVCRFRFKTKRHVECHQAARHATKFTCNLCEFDTTSIEPAKQHGMKHRGIRYQCPYCPEEYLRYTVLMDHMAIKHTPESLCPICGLKLVSDEEVERHKSVRHATNCDQEQWNNVVHCERCDILFACEEAYRYHLGVSIKHDSEFIMEHQKAKRTQETDFIKPPSQYKKTEVIGPLTCEQCGVILPTLRKYHAHFRRDHPDKTRTFYPTMTKKVMCELCGRFLKAQWQYVEHMRLHTNERPFSCEQCGKSFVNNRLLSTHRYVHGVGRARPDIKCKLCGKTFANRGNLHRHMGIHNDEKRFKCEICNTAYRQKAEMKSHYDHVHLRKPWPKRHRPKRDGTTTKSAPTSEDDVSQQYIVEEVAEEMEIDY